MISSVDLLHKKRLVTYEKFKRERIKILKILNKKILTTLGLIFLKKNGFDWFDDMRFKKELLKAINEILVDLKLGMPNLTISLKGELDIKLSKNPSLYVEEFS